MLHTSYIELSKSALQNNIRYMKDRVGEKTRYSMVVKSNAYGHGLEDLLPMIEDCGVDHFSVFSADEAVRAHRVKRSRCDLMIMGWLDDDHLEWAIENEVSFFVFTMDRLVATIEKSKKCRKPARIHIELETGMHRTGFYEDQLDQVIQLLANNRSNICLEGLCTHLAGAESLANYDRVKAQIELFEKRCRRFQSHDLRPAYRHVACSAGVFNYPDATLDLVRVGISNYGFWPSDETKMLQLMKREDWVDPLRRVLSWKSFVMSVNEVDEGEYVSYGKTFLTNRKSKIATVPVGYGYGFNRNLSNRGHVLINGRIMPVIGTVNMNMMVVDVTDLPGVAIGDEVVLVGSQGDKTITVSSFSDMNNSMNYELLTRLPNTIPRQIVQ